MGLSTDYMEWHIKQVLIHFAEMHLNVETMNGADVQSMRQAYCTAQPAEGNAEPLQLDPSADAS